MGNRAARQHAGGVPYPRRNHCTAEHAENAEGKAIGIGITSAISALSAVNHSFPCREDRRAIRTDLSVSQLIRGGYYLYMPISRHRSRSISLALVAALGVAGRGRLGVAGDWPMQTTLAEKGGSIEVAAPYPLAPGSSEVQAWVERAATAPDAFLWPLSGELCLRSRDAVPRGRRRRRR